MVRSRRAALRLSAAAFAASLSGCAGVLDREASDVEATETTTREPTTANDSTTDDPTTHALSWNASLPDGTTEFPDGPKSPPERPEDLTAESVREYATTYERRWVYNRLHRDDSPLVSAECGIDSITEYDLGYRIVVWCTASANGEQDGVTYHADYFTQYATYYVGSNATARHEGEQR